MNDVKNSFDDNPIKARHYGFLFNTYVLMQLFNLINARKLMPHEWNPFANFFNNKYFLGILIVAIGVQIGLVEIDAISSVLKIRPQTLPLLGISLGIGASGILWGFILRLVPLSLFGRMKIDETALTDEEEKSSLVSTLRKSHRQSVRQSAQRAVEFNNRESQR